MTPDFGFPLRAATLKQTRLTKPFSVLRVGVGNSLVCAYVNIGNEHASLMWPVA